MKHFLALLAALAFALAGCSSNDEPSSPDAGTATDAAPPDHEVAADSKGDSPHADSETDAQADAAPEASACEACSSEQVCVEATCCNAPTASGTFQVPAHTSYVHWTFDTQQLSAIEYMVHVENVPEPGVGLYFSPVNSAIDGVMFYLGLQTNMNRPGVGGVGPGVLYSRWDTLDEADTHVAEGGFVEVGTHEGEFVGVRLPYAWHQGAYALRLERGEADGAADWFDLYITDQSTGEQTFAGGLRYPRTDPAVRAVMEPRSTTFTEVYAGATDYANVPAWHLSTMAWGDDAPSSRATSEYPAYPYAEYPNTDVFYDAAEDLVRLRFGGQTPRCHEPGPLFER